MKNRGGIDIKIKYDRRILRILLITAVVFTVPTVVGMIFGFLFDSVTSTFGDVMVIVSVITFCPMLALWLACLDARMYIRELGKAGYEEPDDRRKYGGRLENLPRSGAPCCIRAGRNRDSLISAAAALACALGFAGVTIKYYIQWRYRLSGIAFVFVGISLCILVLCWVIGAAVYYRRSDNSRYRGRFEISDGRKVRSPLFNNIVTILLTAMVSIVFVLVIFSVARCVARTQAGLYGDSDSMYHIAGFAELEVSLLK